MSESESESVMKICFGDLNLSSPKGKRRKRSVWRGWRWIFLTSYVCLRGGGGLFGIERDCGGIRGLSGPGNVEMERRRQAKRRMTMTMTMKMKSHHPYTLRSQPFSPQSSLLRTLRFLSSYPQSQESPLPESSL